MKINLESTPAKASFIIFFALGLSLFTLQWVVNSPMAWQELFTKTGTVGDTIGSIAGPILNFAGMLVVYLSLHEQIVAFKHEREKSRREDFVRSTEHAIKIATKALKHDMVALEESLLFISQFDEYIINNRIAAGSNVFATHLDTIKLWDGRVARAAGALAEAYDKVVSPNLPEEYVSHCMNLFDTKCIKQLSELHLIKAQKTALDQESVNNTLLVMSIKEHFGVARYQHYVEVAHLAGKRLILSWK